MTLAEFLTQLGTVRRPYGRSDSLAVLVFDIELGHDPDKKNRIQLYSLSDYVVTSVVSGPGFVLSPRSDEP